MNYILLFSLSMALRHGYLLVLNKVEHITQTLPARFKDVYLWLGTGYKVIIYTWIKGCAKNVANELVSMSSL